MTIIFFDTIIPLICFCIYYFYYCFITLLFELFLSQTILKIIILIICCRVYYAFYIYYNWYLVTLYKSVLAAEGDQRINEYGRAVLKRLKFHLKLTHCKHYCDVLFPDQIEYILQRKAALAMGLHPRLGKHSLFSRLDDALTGRIFSFSLDNDNNFTSLHNRFAALFAADDYYTIICIIFMSVYYLNYNFQILLYALFLFKNIISIIAIMAI